jgi:hypothetical protein
MAKPKRYPRKFRQTLENVAAARDDRQAQAEVKRDPDPFRVLWQDFVPKNSVHLMSAKIDKVRGRLTTTIMMEPDFHYPQVAVIAPWKSDNNGDAS